MTLDEALTTYEAELGANVAGVDFLMARAGGDKAVAQALASTHRLGVVPEDCLPEHRRFIGWLAIPYLVDDRPVQIRFRCLRSHDHVGHGKYMTMDGDPARVYNSCAIKNAAFEIHVTEGEIDAMILTMLGYPAIAIPGASGFQGHHRRMLAGFSRVYVWGDPDEAGAQFASKVTRMMGQAVSVRLTDGDINETFVAHGEAAIHAAIAKTAI